MKIGVCVKQVAASEARLRLTADASWIQEDDLQFEINKTDEFAVEAALQLAEKTNGEVIAFSLGGERVREALRKVLALGATRAVLMRDPALLGGDALVTGKTLAAAIAREGCNIVFTGSQSDDSGWAATGSVVAAALGWPHAWLVMGVELDPQGDAVSIRREMEAGLNELARVKLPAVLEVQAGINSPRYASLKGIMAAKKKEIAELTAADLGLDPAAVGRAGSLVEVLSIGWPEAGREAVMLEGDPAKVARELVARLQNEARVIR